MRLQFLDGIRGHLLLGMMIVHLQTSGNQSFLKFLHHSTIIHIVNAGFFIPVSGFLLGFIYFERLNSANERWKFLGKRLRVIYKYFLISSLPFLMLSIASRWASDSLTLASIFKEIGLTLILENSGGFADILVVYFYCFLIIALLPFLLEVISMGAFLSVSGIIYLLSQASYQGGFLGISAAHVAFDISAWQFLFMLAFAAGAHRKHLLRKIQNFTEQEFIRTLTAAIIVYAMTLTVRDFITPFEPERGVNLGWPRLHLHPIFLVRVLAMIVVLSLVILHPSKIVRTPQRLLTTYFSWPVLENIGKYGIQMFTLHVYLMIAFLEIQPILSTLQQGILAVAILFAFAFTPTLYHRLSSRLRSSRLTD